jgi:hypothetical protein
MKFESIEGEVVIEDIGEEELEANLNDRGFNRRSLKSEEISEQNSSD